MGKLAMAPRLPLRTGHGKGRCPQHRQRCEGRKGPWRRSSRLRTFNGLELGCIDLDAARLLFLRHDALQIDMQQAVLKARRLDLDMLGELEAALEGAARNALMQEAGLGLVGLFALAADR